MITVNELREVLRSIGFVERNDVFSNSYSSGASIDVNFKEHSNVCRLCKKNRM